MIEMNGRTLQCVYIRKKAIRRMKWYGVILVLASDSVRNLGWAGHWKRGEHFY